MTEKRMVVREAWAPGLPLEELRPEAVQLAMDTLAALALSADEELAVICGLQGKMMVATGTTVVVSATALQLGGQLAQRTVAVNSTAPGLVTVAVERMVQEASPALWSEILSVLERVVPPEQAHE